MICADFLAGAHLENGNTEILLQAVSRLFNFLPHDQKEHFWRANTTGPMIKNWPKRSGIRLDEEPYRRLHRQVLKRDGWRCQICGSSQTLQIHHKNFRSHSGEDTPENLITLCTYCHTEIHRS